MPISQSTTLPEASTQQIDQHPDYSVWGLHCRASGGRQPPRWVEPHTQACAPGHKTRLRFRGHGDTWEFPTGIPCRFFASVECRVKQ